MRANTVISDFTLANRGFPFVPSFANRGSRVLYIRGF